MPCPLRRKGRTVIGDHATNAPRSSATCLPTAFSGIENRGGDPVTTLKAGNAEPSTIPTVSGPASHAFRMHRGTALLDDWDLGMALKPAIGRSGVSMQIPGSFRTIDNGIPVNAASAGIKIDGRREPADGSCSNVQPSCASYWVGRPTQKLRYSTDIISTAKWIDTNFFRADFDSMLPKACASLDTARREELYREMAMMVRDEGGLILSVLNDYINVGSNTLAGYVPDIGNDLSNGPLVRRVWLDG